MQIFINQQCAFKGDNGVTTIGRVSGFNKGIGGVTDIVVSFFDGAHGEISVISLSPAEVEIVLKPESWVTQEKEFTRAEEDAFNAGFTAACQHPHAANAGHYWNKYKGGKS